jgi:hypothetical protein
MLQGKLLIKVLIFSIPAAVLAQQREPPKFEVGAQFTSLSIGTSPSNTKSGFGGRLTYNINKSVALEAEGNFLPSDDTSSFFRNGGRAVEGLFGVKVGKRWERFGLFAKARPGFITFTRGVAVFGPNDPQTGFPSSIQTKSLTHLASDFGGVAEFYVSRHFLTRIDAGATMIRYGPTTEPLLLQTSTGFTTQNFQIPGRSSFNFQFSAGIGYRF